MFIEKIKLLTMKYFISILFITAFVISSYSQRKDNIDQSEKIKAQKMAFITERICLSPADAQKFWPVYNEFNLKKDSLNEIRNNARKALRGNKLSNKQKEEAIDIQLILRQKEAEISKQYHEKFKKILTIDQLIKLYDAEQEFKMRLMRQIRESEACGDCLPGKEATCDPCES